MFIAKSRIEDFDDCRVGDILYEDPDDKSFDWKLYTDQNRITAKLKQKTILPGALVAKIEEKGLNVQTINVYDDSWASTSSVVSGTFINPSSSFPSPTGIITTSGNSFGGGGYAKPIVTYTGRKSGGTSAKIQKPKPAPPITVSDWYKRNLKKCVVKLNRILKRIW